MNFSSKKVLRTFATPQGKNAWGYIEGLGWRRVAPTSTDGVSNVFIMLNAARANNRKVSGKLDASNRISRLYLL